MDQILNIISNVWVILAMIVLVIVLICWLIFVRIKARGFRKDLSEFEERYNEVKNIPLQFKMNKATTIGKVDGETTKKVRDAREVFDKCEANISSIASMLADAEDCINAGKLGKADAIMDQLDDLINEAKSSAVTLNDMLDLILAKETSQRKTATSYKNTFRALKSEAEVHAQDLAYCWDYLEEKISSTEQMFSTFEEWMFSSDYDKANKELENIKASLVEIDAIVEKMPPLLQDARGVIPSLAENLHKDYTRVRNAGVYLGHLEIEKNLSALTVSLKDDLKKLKAGKMDGIRKHLDAYKERINQLDESVLSEGESGQSLMSLAEETEKSFVSVEQNLAYVKEHYASTSVRFGLEGMDADIARREEELRRLQAEKPRVMENVNNHTIPASTVLVSLKELRDEIGSIETSLQNMKQKIEIASGDEDRAKKQVVKLQIIMNQIRVKIRRYKLPNISAQYESDMTKADGYIDTLAREMKQIPLNIQVVNTTLQEALDFIYRLYNDVNNVVGTVVMVENTIVFGNRYRSTYADIDSELTRAELAFRNGEYTQALTMAIATIEKIHPGNYENMIRENAKGA